MDQIGIFCWRLVQWFLPLIICLRLSANIHLYKDVKSIYNSRTGVITYGQKGKVKEKRALWVRVA